MKLKLFATSAAAGIAFAATPAMAQDGEASGPDVFVGGSVGYHDIGAGIPNDDGGIYGVVAGVDVPVSETFFIGGEANYHLGDGVIDSEYGIAARVGIKTGGTKLYVKGGYQEVDFDLAYIAGTAVTGVDDTDGDYMVGVGADIGLSGDNIKLRLNADTIAFDSTRLTAGVLFNF